MCKVIFKPMLKVFTLAVVLAAFCVPPARALSDAELARVLGGFEARRDALLKPLAGKRFKPAKKEAPLAPGRPAYVRGYAWSVTDFAMKTFLLNEPPAPANAALLELFKYFTANKDARDDMDNFYWSMDVVCRLVEFYGRNGSRTPGRLSAEAEDAALDMMYAWARNNSLLADAATSASQTWYIRDSENHHLMRVTTAWQFAKLLMRDPRFSERKYDDGGTAAQHYAAWTEFLKRYFLERARKSLCVEIANGSYNSETLKGVYNVYDFSPDPELKRRAGLFLELYWATWAEEQLGGVRGGGKTRVYPGPQSLWGGYEEIARWAWIYFGLGEPVAPHAHTFTILTSAWRPSSVVADLALDPAGRGVYETRRWPLGLAEKGYYSPPNYRLRTDQGGILRYSYCTPEFIMGSLILAARPQTDWAMISSQNRWEGVIFAGDPNARIFPQVRATSRNRAYNPSWSVQRKGTLITQKLFTSKGAGEMRVWFSDKGLSGRTEKGGWAFVKAPGAYAAVRPAAGTFQWQNDAAFKGGAWLVPAEPYMPVIIEVARASEYRDFADFQARILACPLKYGNKKLEYQGIDGDRFTFDAGQKSLPKINGETVDLAAKKSFDSPFVQSERESGVVTIMKGERREVLDFN